MGANVNTRTTKTWEMFKVMNIHRKANKRIILYLLNWNHEEKSHRPLPELRGNPEAHVAVYAYKLVQEVFGKNSGNTYKES